MWSPYLFRDSSKPLVDFSFSGYGLGWSVVCPNPLNPPQGRTSPPEMVAYHTGAAVGASSVLAVAPDCRDMKWTLYKNGNRMPSGDGSSLQDKSAGNAAVLHTQPTKDVLQVVLSEKVLQRYDKEQDPAAVRGVVVVLITNVNNMSLVKEAMAIIDIFNALR